MNLNDDSTVKTKEYDLEIDLKFVMQAKRALETYLERGRQGIKQLKSSKIDKANRIFRMQKAAWFNFQAAYGLVSSEEQKKFMDQYISEQIEDILDLQQEQEDLITQQCRELGGKAGEIRKNKSHLVKYKRQNNQSANHFEQFI